MLNWKKWLPAALGLSLFAATAVSADEKDKAAEYLSVYYNITPFDTSEATVEDVNGVILALGGEAIDKDELAMGDVVERGIEIAGLKELADTYVSPASPDRAKDVLEEAGIEVPDEYAQYYACALKAGLIEGEEFDILDFLYNCGEAGGNGRHFLGRVSDEDILERVRMSLEGFFLFNDEKLNSVGNAVVLSGATSGYSLKYSGYDAHFLPEYTISYGHEAFEHVEQMVGLLRSHDIDAFLQIEPKISVYEYMMEWGEPADPSPTYSVVEVDEGRYICYAMEYDMSFEFDTKEDKEAFHDLVENYAHKTDDRVDEDGIVTAPLLARSWWQPLYYSETEMENEEFGELISNRVYNSDGSFYINSISLPDQAEAVADAVKAIAPDLEVSSIKVYVNPAFIRYITGEDHQ